LPKLYDVFMSIDSLSSKQFSAGDIFRLLGVDKNRLFYWVQSHRLLTPGIQKGRGTGNRSIFSLGNLIEIALIREMIAVGQDLNSIKEIKDELDRNRDWIEEILSADNMDWLCLEIRRDKDRLFLNWKTETMVGEFDSDGVGMCGKEELLIALNYDSKDECPNSYASVWIEIGRLAKDLIAKIGKE